ncbi:MAG TPA: single-stranded DNA-binding protein [bacterium]|nr:single-stranded DNA-binding protein [bacterium]HPS29519.1 single-stranded DNA-binding protein [bacterium]
MSSFNSLNKVMILGRLGRDPEKKYTASGIAVCNFSVATSESVKKGNAFEEKTEWHKIIVFGNQAETVSKYVKKGSLVFIEGRIQTRSYQDKEGHEKYVTEIIANSVRFLDLKDGGSSERVYQHKDPSVEASNDGAAVSEPVSIDGEEDDLPF